MKQLFLSVCLLTCTLHADELLRVTPDRTLHEGSNFKPYPDRGAWQQRAEYLRQQVLIAAGLWPLPPRTPLNAEVYGKIDCGDYTVEKVHFESYPGFFVTGNLYRPKGKNGPFPAVLSPHGHWENGRFYEATPQTVAAQLKGGWETEENAARYPLQARAANLAKLGCVVFFYDMVGYADADPQHFPHRQTYRDVDSDLHLLSVFGLQTWDSIRAVDFVSSLPEVDPKRIACTGASGGGTQTFILMSVEDRLAAAAPVCMISAGEHQGGCVCENNSLLRVGTDNVELAATFAPRPFIHPTATGDWTMDFLEHGFPEIRATYSLFGAAEQVESFRQNAGHNYNRKSREAVYNFFNKHLNLGHKGQIEEQPFEPLTPKELSVWDSEHSRPANAVDAAGLKKYWVDMTALQIAAYKPTDAASLKRMRSIFEPALRHMVSTSLPTGDEIEARQTSEEKGDEEKGDKYIFHRLRLHRKGDAQSFSAVLLTPANPAKLPPKLYVSLNGIADFTGEGKYSAGIGKIATVQPVLLIDVVGSAAAAPQPAIEFFAGYNRTTLANRVHDTLTAIAFLRARERQPIDLVAAGEAGLHCLLARALAGDAVRSTSVGNAGYNLAVGSTADPNYLPGSLRYGGIGPMAALCAPGELHLNGWTDAAAIDWVKSAYRAAGAEDKLHITPP